MKTLSIAALMLLGSTADASVICSGCEYDEGSAGSYLGTFNPFNQDIASFQHTGVGQGRFEDFWVFDLTANAIGSISADFTLLASIKHFVGELYQDNGSICAVSCSDIELGQLIASADANASRWEIFDLFAPGRYVLRISGVGHPINQGVYTGQLAFLGFSVNEAGTLSLIVIGLLLMGLSRIRRPQ